MSVSRASSVLGALVTVSGLAPASSCPGPGWMEVASSCYLVSPEPMSWYAAQEFCWSQGGYLAEIKSKYEEDGLDQVLASGNVYWIGLTDQAQEGSFVWAESHQELQYSNWGPSDPNDLGQGEQNCVLKSLEADDWRGWIDYKCPEQSAVGYTDTEWDIHPLCETQLPIQEY